MAFRQIEHQIISDILRCLKLNFSNLQLNSYVIKFAENHVRLSEFFADIGVLLQTSERVGTPESTILLYAIESFKICIFPQTNSISSPPP